MKKLLLFSTLLVITFNVFGQSWSSSNGVLYTNPSTTKIGLGTSSPYDYLDVRGNIFVTGAVRGLTGTFTHNSNTINHYALQWMMDSWTSAGPTLMVSAYGGMKFFCAGQLKMALDIHGNLGIGTYTPLAKLDVRGTLRANEILVNTVSGADFVFENNYQIPSLSYIDSYIKENHHLPEIPSAAEMQANGVSLDKLVIQLLQKVEELTIYTIQQEERIKELENHKR